MKKLIEIVREINRILDDGIEILPNSPIHEKLRQELKIYGIMEHKYMIAQITKKYYNGISKGADMVQDCWIIDAHDFKTFEEAEK